MNPDTIHINVIGSDGYEGRALVSPEELAELKRGKVVSIPNRRGFGVAMHYQRLDVQFEHGFLSVEFISPIALDETRVRASLEQAVLEQFEAVMGVRT